MNFNDINWWVVFGIVSRVASMVILAGWVIPVQWRELKRQFQRKESGKDGYWKLALELLLIVMITITCAIIPVTYQGTRITSDNSLTLQNLAGFFTNFGILVQSIGWLRIYRSKYDDRE